MPLPLNTVLPGDIILSDDWNDLVHLANKFRIDSGKLQIKNDGDIDGNDSFTSGLTSTVCLGDENHFVQAKKDFGLTIAAEWAPAGLIIRKGGDTGIGTTDPKAKLDLHGGDEWTVDKWNKNLRLRGESPAVIFTEYGFNTNNKFGIGTKNNGSKLMIFSTNTDQEDTSGTSTSHFVVQEDGRIGIGTTGPSQKLEIAGQALVNGNWVDGPDATLSLGDTNHFIRSTLSKGVTIGTYGANYLSGSAPGIFLKEGGNVGIGIDTPDAKLVIRQSSNSDWSVQVLNGAGSGAGLVVKAATAGSSSALLEAQLWNGTSRFKVQANGNVGIGTITPNSALHIKRNAGALNIEGNNHTYLQFYPFGYANGRKAWLGFGSGNTTTLSINNSEAGGDLDLRTNGKILVNGYPLLRIITFKNIPTDTDEFETNYLTSVWHAVIGGTNALWTNKPLYMYPSGSTWKIKKQKITAPPIPPQNIIEITVLFIKKEISQLL